MRLLPISTPSLRPAISSAFVLVAITLLVADPFGWFQGFARRATRLSPAAETKNLDSQRRSKIANAYGQLPLSFERNVGQFDPRVSFKARGLNYDMFLTANEAVLALRSDKQANEVSVLRMNLIGASRRAKVVGLDEAPGKLNYLVGNDQSKWRRNVAAYAQVRYLNAYPGIDLVYHGNQQQLEYDFVIAPNASPRRIRMAFAGSNKISIDGEGNLILNTPAGDVRQNKPIAYQEINGERREVAVGYKLDGKTVTFQTGAYDKSYPLIIDPVLIYSTYLGGTSSEQGLGIAVDSNGSAYLTGNTFSTDFPLADPFQGTKDSSNDAFVVKLNPAGTALVYATYLGGSLDDNGTAIAVDAQGSAYVAGGTSSENFPHTVGAAQETRDGLVDAFLTKLSPSGSSLSYSTFLGGDNAELAFAVAVDSSNRAYVVGRSDSTRFRNLTFANPRNGHPAYKSTNNAAQWSPASSGLTASTVSGLAIDPSNSNTLYAATNYGVFKSTDAGANWSLTGTASPATNPFPNNVVVVDPTNSQTIHVGAQGGIYKSTDGGATYARSNFFFFSALSLAIDPTNSNIIYAGTSSTPFKSTNGGDTWTQINTGITGGIVNVNDIVIDPTNTAIIYMGTSRSVFKSINGGASWTQVNSPVMHPFVRVGALAIDPTNPLTLYAGGGPFDQAMYKTIDGGATWTVISTGLTYTSTSGLTGIPFINSIAVDPVTSTSVYAATTGGGLYKSTNAGASWSQSNAGFPNANSNDVKIDNNNPAIIYAATAIGYDVFALRLNSAGSAIEYLSNFGGHENDEPRGIAVDTDNSAYVVGSTASNNFPTVAAFQLGHAGLGDGFVTKINASGTAFTYSTYLGGIFNDVARGVAVRNGRAYVVGQTSSSDFPLVNPLKPAPVNFDADAFVTILNASGTSLDFSTCVGGTFGDQGFGIALDPTGTISITGLTNSLDFPAVAAPQSTPLGAIQDAFITRLDAAGTSFIYSGRLGGNSTDAGNGIAVDAAGNAYIVGTTSSNFFPTVSPFQSTLKGSSDAFVTKIGLVADLSLTKTDFRDPVMVNNDLVYSLELSNSGPDAAANVVVSDTLPGNVTLVSATSSQGSCSGTGTVTCNLGTIANGAGATISITVKAPSSGTITNTATVSSSTVDNNTANNSSTQQTQVSTLPSIAGRVTHASAGAGVGSVSMTLSGSQSANTTTAANGLYQFPDLTPGGNYTVTPARPGFVFHPQSITLNNLTADATANFSAVTCVFQIAPVNQTFSVNGGFGQVSVTANDSLCPWTATSDVPWITVLGSPTGRGAGTASFSVAPTNVSRSGTLRIGENVFTVWQELSPCDPPTFTTAPRFAAGLAPVYITHGDFNNDNKQDVVVLNDSQTGTPHRVSMLLGDGAGGFGPVNFVAAGGTPRWISSGDFNNDGKLDVVTLIFGQSSNVKVFLGDGAGNLIAGGTFTAGGLPTSLAIGNFNGDANLDIAVSNEDSHNVSILLGTGLGTFGPTTQIGGTNSVILHAAKRVVIADINKDNKQDLIVQGSFLWSVLGNGDGTFATPIQLANNLMLGAVVVSDFNKDGKDDIAGTGGSGNVIRFVPGDGVGGFGSPIDSSTGGRGPSNLLVADFNGDGNPDLGASNSAFQSSQDVSAYLGNGAGAFTPGPAYVTGQGPRELTSADFNSDGRPDLAVADTSILAGSGSVVLLVGNGSGGFIGARSFLAPQVIGELVSDDFNSDGKRDLLAFATNGIYLLPATAPGEFGNPVLVSNAVAASSGMVRRLSSTSDFNRDGQPDIAVHTLQNSQSHVRVLLNNGAGVFTEVTDLVLENVNGSVLFADFNADGNPDLISMVNFFFLQIRLGNGTGGFNSPVTISPQTTNVARLEAGDFNGDRKLDLAVASFGSGCGSGDSALQILYGDGSGGFSAPVLVSQFGVVSVARMLAHDLNGDGRSDLIVINGCTGDLLVLFASSTGNFTPSAEFTAGDDPSRLVLGDLSGDGKPDLVVGNGNSNGITNLIHVLTGDGGGGFSAPVFVIAESAAASMDIADFDGNGHNDLALAPIAAGHIALLLNSCPVTQPASTVQFAAPSFSANEGSFVTTVSVTRSGNVSGAASVKYSTFDGSASARSDYTTAVGTLNFAAGETSKTFEVLLTDDALVEGTESLTLSLTNLSGVSAGVPNSVVLSIIDNDAPGGGNPISSSSEFFVRQHYHDFLNREPDAAGLAFWVDQIESCGADPGCREVKRINVSAAFFLSIEFQETGYLAYRAYNAAYGSTTSPNVAGTVPIIRLHEFLPDSQQIGFGVQVGIGNWEQQLEDNKNAYVLQFVQTPRFLAAFPLSMTADQFVTKLDQNAGGVLSADEKAQLVAFLAVAPADATRRASVLRSVAEDSDLRQRELNRAFVLMQFYGYLRRNPDDPQDTDFSGWKFWLDKLNQFNGNFVDAEMVKSFLVSGEYRQRFGTP